MTARERTAWILVGRKASASADTKRLTEFVSDARYDRHVELFGDEQVGESRQADWDAFLAPAIIERAAAALAGKPVPAMVLVSPSGSGL